MMHDNWNDLKRCFFVFAFVSSFAFNARGQVEIPAEAIKGWQEMAQMLDPIQFTMSYNDLKEGTSVQYRCSIQNSKEKCEFLHRDKRGEHEQVAIHNGHGFLLRRPSGSKWQLNSLYDPGEQIALLKNVVVLAKMGYSVHGSATLLEVPNNSRFKLEYFKNLEDGTGIVEARIRDELLSATAVFRLDPDKRFRVISSTHWDDGDPIPATYECEYSDQTPLGQVVPSRYFIDELQREWKLLSIAHERLPDSEFKLSHYGLPDFVEPSRVANWWLLLFLTAIVVTVFVFWKTRARS
jgi:hypothetical protein